MKPSKAQREATYRYDKKVYDRILVRLPKGTKDRISAAAAENGESVNAFINQAVMAALPKIDILDFANRYALYDAINDAHFGGQLPRPEISLEHFDDRHEGAAGRYTYPVGDLPATIRIPTNTERLAEHAKYYDDDYVAAYAYIMAHEMVHHYCALNGIKDHDGNIHTVEFARAAQQLGLIDDDWILTYCSGDYDGLQIDRQYYPNSDYSLCIGLPDIDLDEYMVGDHD